jgi:hypothetical protein
MQDPELAGQRNYSVFIAALYEFLPPAVQTWNELHPRVRQAWIDAAAAVIQMES